MLKIKKIKPIFNRILVTANKYEEEMIGSIIDGSKSNTIKEYQTVVEVGNSVSIVKPGDVVVINPIRYAVRKHQEGSLKDGVITDNPVTHYNFNIIEVDDKPYILLYDADVDYVLEDYEEIEEPKQKIIVPQKPKIVLN